MRGICPCCNSHSALGEVRCFKCGFRQFKFTSGLLYTIPPEDSELSIPEGLVFNPHQFHPDAIAWLSQAHIFNDVIVKQGIAYSPLDHKVFIPAYDKHTTLRFYELRALDPKVADKYKYLTYGKSSQYMIKYIDHISDSVVIVEDHLSAIRLRKYANVVSLSGTHLSFDRAEFLCSEYSHFIFWLDSDIPGVKAFFKCMDTLKKEAIKRLSRRYFQGLDVPTYSFSHIDYVTIKQDPKKYRDSEIIDILRDRGILCGDV